MIEGKQMVELFAKAREKGASDLHLTAGCQPVIRYLGNLIRLNEQILQAEEIAALADSLMNPMQKKQFLTAGEIDFAYKQPDGSRYRINVFRQCNQAAIAARVISSVIPSCKELQLPQSVCRFINCRHGLVLITGPTGSGKSTTLAALLDKLNAEKNLHIITLEDPIEYRHEHKGCLINQREIGTDTASFATGLHSALREDPDVIMVGELRDAETVATALTAAETGHLVLSTLHTGDAVTTVNRIIDFFPEHQQQIRAQLAECLQGIACQELILGAEHLSRVAAFEIMTMTPALRNLIREGKMHQIASYIQTGRQYGMITKNDYIQKLAMEGKINI